VAGLAVMAEFVPGVKQTRVRVWLRWMADGCLVAVLLARQLFKESQRGGRLDPVGESVNLTRTSGRANH
jgi:hypothetical protein